MKKVLVQTNEDKADLLLSHINSLYLTRIGTLTAKIGALGIARKDLTKDMVLQLIAMNYQPLRELHRAIYQKDLEVFDTPEMRDQVESKFASKFKEVELAAMDLHIPEIAQHLPFSLKVLAGVFELDKDGKPFIPEERAIVIRESFKEFIEDSEMLRIYTLHVDVAQKLQDLVTAVRKNRIDRVNSGLMMGGYSILSLFEIEDNIMEGTYSVRPRKLTYKAEPVEVFEE